MMRMLPPPEMMMRMPMGGPGMRMPPPAEMLRMLPPELMQRMPMGPGMGPGMRMPPPAEMLRMLPPEMLMRPPPPEVAKMMNFELPPEPMNGVDPGKEEKKKAIRLLQAGNSTTIPFEMHTIYSNVLLCRQMGGRGSLLAVMGQSRSIFGT